VSVRIVQNVSDMGFERLEPEDIKGVDFAAAFRPEDPRFF
jgi:hypothetical protein